MAEANLRWRAETADAIAHIEALKAAIGGIDDKAKQSGSPGGGIVSFAIAWKVLVPAVVAGGAALLAFTGNMSLLAPLVPVLTVALTGLLVPFTTLAAVVVGFIPPVTLLVGLLGGLAAAFGFGAKAALTSQGHFSRLQHIVDQLQGRFAALTRTLAHDFMPIFMFLAGSAQHALNYLDKLAKLPLDKAFNSFATTGVAGLQKFLDHVGSILEKPLRLAFKVAFGKDDTLRKALIDDWNDAWAFLTKGPNSPGHFIARWFGRQDFTAVGYRWGSELAGGIVKALGMALGRMLSSQGGKFLLFGGVSGAVIGTAIGGPIGGAIGLAIGVAIGIVLNHYWPKIKADARRAFDDVKGFLKSALGPKLWSEIIGDARSFWGVLKSIAGFLKNDVYPVVKTIWDKIGGWGTVIGLAKFELKLLAVVFHTVADSARTVAGVVGTIVSALETAVGLAERLKNALGGANNPLNFTPVGPLLGNGPGSGARNPGGQTIHPATGGLVTGGVPGADSVPALLTPGELVLNKRQQLALLHGGTGPRVIQLHVDLGRGVKQVVQFELRNTARGLQAARAWGG